MEVDELGPFEKVIDQVGCVYNKSATNKTGVLIVTSCRVLWKPAAEASFPVQIFRGMGVQAQKKENPKSKMWILKIDMPSTAECSEQSYMFRFRGPQAKEDCTKVE